MSNNDNLSYEEQMNLAEAQRKLAEEKRKLAEAQHKLVEANRCLVQDQKGLADSKNVGICKMSDALTGMFGSPLAQGQNEGTLSQEEQRNLAEAQRKLVESNNVRVDHYKDVINKVSDTWVQSFGSPLAQGQNAEGQNEVINKVNDTMAVLLGSPLAQGQNKGTLSYEEQLEQIQAHGRFIEDQTRLIQAETERSNAMNVRIGRFADAMNQAMNQNVAQANGSTAEDAAPIAENAAPNGEN